MNAQDISALTRLRIQLRESLARINQRERNMLIGGVALIAITLIWLLFGWQSNKHRELDIAIPRTSAQLARMQSESADLARLRSLPSPAAPDLTQLVKSLEGTATAHGLKLNIRNDGSQLVVSGKGINFDSWAPWLAETQQANALRLSYLDITQGPGGPQLEARLSPL